MLIHHSPQDYNQAASEAAKIAKVKMEEIIHRGKDSAISVLESVSRTIIKDRLSKGENIQFNPVGADSTQIYLSALDEAYDLHNHALIQAIQRSGLPNANKFLELMRSHGDVGNELLAHNLTELFRQSEKTNLVRTVQGQCRGLLSDRFRRMDARPLLDKFSQACKEIGARPIEGHAEDTRVTLKAVLPYVFEPVPNEVMIFGLQWQTSDFGHGAHNLTLWTMRLWCTNKAILEEALRQIHLGRKLDESINFSAETMRLDTELAASALYDVARSILSPDRINLYLEGIKEANEEKLSSTFIGEFLKKKFAKAEQEKIIEKFNSADIEMLPAGQTKWRLSNAISFIANDEPNVDKKLHLESVAGELIPFKERLKPVLIQPNN